MYDKELALEVLQQIHHAIFTIMRRFDPVNSVEDFTGSPAGMEKLDSICMLLIAVGESLKNLDKITGGSLLTQYPQVDWKKAKGLRDIISHHYFEIDADAIFHVCKTYIAPMHQTIRQIIESLS
ncbi:MAG: DUF86 domain-containing protein [Dissulfuribacterales bacterium]